MTASVEPFPVFRAHPLLPGGHAQTLASIYFPGRLSPYRATQHRVQLDDGDTLVLHDDCPADWRPVDQSALLMHGLAGCHQSPYMIRVARKLNDRGVRTFRMDHRGCGAGSGLARLPYHAGRSDDALQVLRYIHEIHPDSPISVIGFSLSGNVTLKLLGESSDELPDYVDRGVAINPPIELATCINALRRPVCQIYDRHFVKLLNQQVRHRQSVFADAPTGTFSSWPRRIADFDDTYTAPVSGFGNAGNYYERCSSRQFLPSIRIPTLILTARDDPLVPVASFAGLTLPPSVTLHIADRGGHLGYIARRGTDPDQRWMDWRIVDWITASLPAAIDAPADRTVQRI